LTNANQQLLQGALVSVLQHYPQAHAGVHALSFASCAYFLGVYRLEVSSRFGARLPSQFSM
jgi:hypothetical protein